MDSDNGTFMYGKEIANDLSEEANDFVLDDTVNIPRGEYEDLIDDSYFLEALRMAGVEGWEGWDDALEIYDDMVGVEEERPKLRLVTDEGVQV